VCYSIEGGLCLLEVFEVFEVLEMLEMLEVMRCLLLCMLESVRDGLSFGDSKFPSWQFSRYNPPPGRSITQHELRIV